MNTRVYANIMHQHHTIIGGTPGAGKSVVMNGLVYVAMCNTPQDVQLILIDPKRVELSAYRKLPHCISYAETPEQAVKALRFADKIIDKRYKKLKRHGLQQWPGGHVFVLVDELADLVLDSTYKREILDLLQSISGLGRAANVHLIAATQAPNRQVIPARLAVNFTAQLALRCRSAIESRQIVKIAGAEDLPRHGRGIYFNPDVSCPGYIDIPMIPREKLVSMVASWRKRIMPQPLAED